MSSNWAKQKAREWMDIYDLSLRHHLSLAALLDEARAEERREVVAAIANRPMRRIMGDFGVEVRPMNDTELAEYISRGFHLKGKPK